MQIYLYAPILVQINLYAPILVHIMLYAPILVHIVTCTYFGAYSYMHLVWCIYSCHVFNHVFSHLVRMRGHVFSHLVRMRDPAFVSLWLLALYTMFHHKSYFGRPFLSVCPLTQPRPITMGTVFMAAHTLVLAESSDFLA